MKFFVCEDFMLIDHKKELEVLGPDSLIVVDKIDEAPLHDPLRGERLALVTSEISNRDMLEVIKLGRAESVIQPFRPDILLRDLKSWVKLRSDEKNYFENPILVLLPECLHQKQISCVSGETLKDFIRSEVEAFLHPFGNKSAHAAISAVFEELYMNAVIDAPREANSADNKHKIDILLGVDSHSILIGFRDYFGSLAPEKLLEKLIRVADMGKFSSMNFSPVGGAGIGTTILMENSSHVFFGRQKDQVSLVCSLIPRNLNNRDRQTYPRTMHFVF